MNDYFFTPIGYMKSCYVEKNGTPRQPSISSVSKGSLTIQKSIFNNPDHSIEGLAAFSHVWLLFVFHLNKDKSVKAKVKPPRLNGSKSGVFSTRSPHRPNPIGLTLAKLTKVDKDTLYLTGIDIVDGTPIIDVKPYITIYDQPQFFSVLQSECVDDDICSSVNVEDNNTELSSNYYPNANSDCTSSDAKDMVAESDKVGVDQVASNSSSAADWIQHPPIPSLTVSFTDRALSNLSKFKSSSDLVEKDWVLNHLKPEELQQAITDLLQADPRSSYRRNKCSDRLYYVVLDNVHVTAWFDETTSPHCAEILRVVPKQFINL